MKRILIAFLLCVATAIAAESEPLRASITAAVESKTVTINYDTVFSKWSAAVAFSEQTRASVEAVNAKLTIKTNTRDAILKQAQEIAAKKPKDEGEAKQLQVRFDAAKVELDAANKEVQALQDSQDLRKQTQDKQVELRKQAQAVIAKQAEAMKADLVLDASALNAYGAPVVAPVSGVRDITDAVIAALNTPPPAPPAAVKAPAGKK